MLLIGELNEKDAFLGGEIPVPLSAAVPVLVAAVESPDQIDAVRVAAMAGLFRHVRLGGVSTPEAKKLAVVAMYKLLKTGSRPRTVRPRATPGYAGRRPESSAKSASRARRAWWPRPSPPWWPMTRCSSPRAARPPGHGQVEVSGARRNGSHALGPRLGRLAFDACAAEAPVTFSQQRITERIAAVPAGLRARGKSKGIAPLMTTDAQKKLLADLTKAMGDLNKADAEKTSAASPKPA